MFSNLDCHRHWLMMTHCTRRTYGGSRGVLESYRTIRSLGIGHANYLDLDDFIMVHRKVPPLLGGDARQMLTQRVGLQVYGESAHLLRFRWNSSKRRLKPHTRPAGRRARSVRYSSCSKCTRPPHSRQCSRVNCIPEHVSAKQIS